MSDLVFPFVNSDDEEWRKQYLLITQDTLKIDGSRFRNLDQLKYLIRLVEQNAKWLNRIYILISSISQIPSFINKEKCNFFIHKSEMKDIDINQYLNEDYDEYVKKLQSNCKESKIWFVTHKVFIPHEFLPTFNSCTIEMFIHKVPELNEKFIYGNDDMFFISETKESDFFKINLPKVSYSVQDIKKHRNSGITFYDTAIRCSVLNEKKGQLFNLPYHGLKAFNKSNFKKAFDLYYELIIKSITKFRNNLKNFNIYLFYDYAISNALCIKTDNYNKYFIMQSEKDYDFFEKFINEHDDNIKTLCLNDNDSNLFIVNKFNKILENICLNKTIYEI